MGGEDEGAHRRSQESEEETREREKEHRKMQRASIRAERRHLLWVEVAQQDMCVAAFVCK